jgi:hypothetical protein
MIMDKDIKLKDEPVEEQSPELVKKNPESPAKEADGNYSIRSTTNENDKKNYPHPSENDRKYQNQDEFDQVEKDNRS